MPHVVRDPVVFGDKCLDRRVEVRKCRPQCTNPHLRMLREIAKVLIDDIEDAAVERLVHVSPNVRFVHLGLGRRHNRPKSCPVEGRDATGAGAVSLRERRAGEFRFGSTRAFSSGQQRVRSVDDRGNYGRAREEPSRSIKASSRVGRS